ncbi:hypothetical protein FB451DRAFT_1170486 [Mycena latifolia]|nr:hypothetical protein FB451DRAFT_1170486 [Mycena latifolia]
MCNGFWLVSMVFSDSRKSSTFTGREEKKHQEKHIPSHVSPWTRSARPATPAPRCNSPCLHATTPALPPPRATPRLVPLRAQHLPWCERDRSLTRGPAMPQGGHRAAKVLMRDTPQRALCTVRPTFWPHGSGTECGPRERICKCMTTCRTRSVLPARLKILAAVTTEKEEEGVPGRRRDAQALCSCSGRIASHGRTYSSNYLKSTASSWRPDSRRVWTHTRVPSTICHPSGRPATQRRAHLPRPMHNGGEGCKRDEKSITYVIVATEYRVFRLRANPDIRPMGADLPT